MKLKNYKAPSAANWQGRLDSLAKERFFQIIEMLDLSSAMPLKIPKKNNLAFALIGFSCDAGIKRNLGRLGAARGPQEFRKIFGNLSVPEHTFSLYDLGDLECSSDHVEQAQEELSKLVKWALSNNFIPIIIGGGHELSFGGYWGAAQAINAPVGIINFDAHFDIRPLGPKGASSGTSFSQMAQWCEQNERTFDYLVLGLQPAANTQSLFAQAKKLGVTWLDADSLISNPSKALAVLDIFLNKHDHIYLSLCLDVFAESISPGVSAPQSLGLLPRDIRPLLNHIIKSKKALCFDLAEYSPPLDSNNQTGKLCAALAYEIISCQLLC